MTNTLKFETRATTELQNTKIIQGEMVIEKILVSLDTKEVIKNLLTTREQVMTLKRKTLIQSPKENFGLLKTLNTILFLVLKFARS